MKSIQAKISRGMIIFIVLISPFLSACKKYLDIKSDSALAVPTTIQDLQGLLDDGNLMNIQTTPSLIEASSDDYFIDKDIYSSLWDFDREVYEWKLREYNFQNDWSLCYSPIYNANICLERIDDIPVTEQNQILWNNVKGSSLFYRAYYFFNLASAFSKAFDKQSANDDLGIVLRLNSDPNIPSLRSTVLETYTRIITDAKESAVYLPEQPHHVMRPSRGAAFGLIAKVYLAMREYDSAYKYSNECLLINSSLMDYGDDPDIPGSINDETPFLKFNKETIFYTEMNTQVTTHYPWQAYIDSSLVESYEDDDLRKNAFLQDDGTGYKIFKGSYSGNPYSFFSGIATDEVYLIRAECNARRGNTVDAMKDITTLLDKRWRTGYFPVRSVAGPEEALTMILSERRKELLMRGIRWSDIKRLNKENRSIIPARMINQQIISLEPNSRYYALPIPQDIIRLSGIQQN